MLVGSVTSKFPFGELSSADATYHLNLSGVMDLDSDDIYEVMLSESSRDADDGGDSDSFTHYSFKASDIVSPNSSDPKFVKTN